MAWPLRGPRRLAALTAVEETTGSPFRDLEAGGTRGGGAMDQDGALSVGKVSPSWFDGRKPRPGGTSLPPQSHPALGRNPGLPAFHPGLLARHLIQNSEDSGVLRTLWARGGVWCCAFFCLHVPGVR